MSKLTQAQQRLLNSLSEEPVYVFLKNGEYTFGKDKDSTANRLYTTLTCRSLLKRGIIRVKECFVNGSLLSCVGIVEVVDVQ